LGHNLSYGNPHVIFNGSTYEDASNPAFYNWTYLDILGNVATHIFSEWLLTFTECPISMSQGGGPVDPPKNLTVYAQVIARIYMHFRQGWPNSTIGYVYPRYVEIGNEPDLPVFWNGTQAEFFELYGNVSLRLRQLDPDIAIGGPGLANVSSGWASAFLAYVKKNNLPMDFFSWHCYDDNSSKVVDAMMQGKQIVRAAGFPDALLFLDEWGRSLNNGTGWDSVDAALHAANVLFGAQNAGIDGLCYAMAKDAPIAYNNSLPTQEANFGLVTSNSTPKPTYYCLGAFREIEYGFGNLIRVTQTPLSPYDPNLNFLASEWTYEPLPGILIRTASTNIKLIIVNDENRSIRIGVLFTGIPTPVTIGVEAKEMSAMPASEGNAWMTMRDAANQLQSQSVLILELSPRSITVVNGFFYVDFINFTMQVIFLTLAIAVVMISTITATAKRVKRFAKSASM
jgi:hypothetical protein